MKINLINSLLRKIKNFFNVFLKSITSFSYYKEIVKAPFKFSLKYLFFLLFILTLFPSIKSAISLSSFISKAPELIATIKKETRSLFPNELVVTIRNGELSTNVKEPYYIERAALSGDLKDSHFITINTNASADDIQSLNTLILITKKSAIVRENNGFKIYPFSGIKETLVIDKSGYEKAADKLLPYLDYLPKILTILVILVIIIWPFAGAIFWLGGELIYLLITSLFLLLIAALMKRKIQYGKIYQMSMHAITLPILINFILGFLGTRLPFLIPTGILLVFMGLVISRFGKK